MDWYRHRRRVGYEYMTEWKVDHATRAGDLEGDDDDDDPR